MPRSQQGHIRRRRSWVLIVCLFFDGNVWERWILLLRCSEALERRCGTKTNWNCVATEIDCCITVVLPLTPPSWRCSFWQKTRWGFFHTLHTRLTQSHVISCRYPEKYEAEGAPPKNLKWNPKENEGGIARPSGKALPRCLRGMKEALESLLVLKGTISKRTVISYNEDKPIFRTSSGAFQAHLICLL